MANQRSYWLHPCKRPPVSKLCQYMIPTGLFVASASCGSCLPASRGEAPCHPSSRPSTKGSHSHAVQVLQTT